MAIIFSMNMRYAIQCFTTHSTRLAEHTMQSLESPSDLDVPLWRCELGMSVKGEQSLHFWAGKHQPY